jgi:hypothetical protein
MFHKNIDIKYIYHMPDMYTSGKGEINKFYGRGIKLTEVAQAKLSSEIIEIGSIWRRLTLS